MAYVDLNPIRAKMAKSLDTSEYTSLHRRLGAGRKDHSNQSHDAEVKLQSAIQNSLRDHGIKSIDQPIRPLLSFTDAQPSAEDPIPISFRDYLKLVDATGRIIRPNKRGSIGRDVKPILERLNVDASGWLLGATRFEDMYRRHQTIGKPIIQTA